MEKNIKLSKVFSGDFLRIITNYSETIQNVLNSYDVVIFMARKAICFYQSMITNKIIVPTKCEVISSRVLDYNTIDKLKNKKIAIIDDVVVKGRSLEKVINILDRNNITGDIYFAASEKSVAEKVFEKTSHIISPKFVYLDSSEIYLFSGLITEYIELSMCPFNIDQPIFECKQNIVESIREIEKLHPFYISSGLQKKYSINSCVLHLKYTSFTDNDVAKILEKSILKIRFLYNKNRILAVPFVLFPTLTNTELDILYNFLKTSATTNLIHSPVNNIINENKLKIINFFFSELLFNDFYMSKDFQKMNSIDFYQFYTNTNQLYPNILREKQNSYRPLEIIKTQHDNFLFSSLVGKAITYIFSIDVNKQNFLNSLNQKIVDKVIIFSYLLEKFKEDDIPYYIVSSIIDVLIDRGMIVPTIVHYNNNVLRAYKLGEYSKLTRIQILSFAAMLYEYQLQIDEDLGKIEFEKLCVLFFNQAINLRLFDQQTYYEDDCYSVCYSLYGPRISDGNTIYKVNSNSTLINDFLDDRIVREKADSYIINPIFLDNATDNASLKNFANVFALQYARLKKLFDTIKKEHDATNKEALVEHNNSPKTITPWNQFVHTYNQYLTLRAIGNSKKNQFLSLCAELYQILLLDDYFFEFNAINKYKFSRIVSGINSGLWKYFCYKNNALDKTNYKIMQKDVNTGISLEYANIFVREDQNPALEKMMDEAGKILFSCAFLIQNLIQTLNKLDYLKDTNNSESEIDGAFSENEKMIFSPYYYKMFSEEKHFFEEQLQNLKKSREDVISFSISTLNNLKDKSRIILDYCDLFLVSATPAYTYNTKFIVLYDPQSNIPQKIGSLHEIFLENISDNSTCKVFNLPDKETGNVVLNEILKNTFEISSINYIILDMNEPEHGCVQICEKAKGSFISKLISKEINFIKSKPLSSSHEMIFIRKDPVNDFDRVNYKFIKKETKKIHPQYVRTILDIICNS